MTRRASLSALATACALAMLAGCASAPPPVEPVAPQPAPARPDDRDAERRAAAALAAFEGEQREAAALAERQGHWADAARVWEVVLALRPDDSTAGARRVRAQQAARDGAALRVARAQQARRSGDLDAAVRLYLEALALAPGDAGAADALREIEHQRPVRASAQAGRAMPSRRPGAAQPRQGTDERNELEHASLLAAQGEFGAAIATLLPLMVAGRGPQQVREKLADLYLGQAEQLRASDRAAAIAALEHCLQLRPTDLRALERLRQLRAVTR